VRKSVGCVVCCCHCACHSCWWALPKVWWFASISEFLGSWAFEYCMYCIESIHWWNMYTISRLRRQAVAFVSAGAPLGLLPSCIWCLQGYFGLFMLFSRFIVSLSMFRYRLFGGRVCLGL
jgi:uncharacterized membrane protein